MIIDGIRYSFMTVYKVKGEEDYLYTIDKPEKEDRFAYITLQIGDMLPSCHGHVSSDYLRESCTKVTFKKLPSEVQKHVRDYILYALSN